MPHLKILITQETKHEIGRLASELDEVLLKAAKRLDTKYARERLVDELLSNFSRSINSGLDELTRTENKDWSFRATINAIVAEDDIYAGTPAAGHYAAEDFNAAEYYGECR